MDGTASGVTPSLDLRRPWSWSLLDDADTARSLAEALGAWLVSRRWFAGKSRVVRRFVLDDAVPWTAEARWLFLQVEYALGASERYAVLAAVLPAARVDESRHVRIAHLTSSDGASFALVDALADESVGRRLLEMIDAGREAEGKKGRLRARRLSSRPGLANAPDRPLQPRLVKAEQSNTSVVWNDRLICKQFRLLAAGENPEVEMGAYLTERARFRHTAATIGSVTYHATEGASNSLAVIQEYVPHTGDAWQLALDELARFFDRAAGLTPPGVLAPEPAAFHRRAEAGALQDEGRCRALLGRFVDWAELLGRRSGELHVALGTETLDQAFAPEPWTIADQERLAAETASLADRAWQAMRAASEIPLAEEDRRNCDSIKTALLARLPALRSASIGGWKIRCHGDYHLGQVLFTGDDFTIIDFEGEPSRPPAERRRKQSPLRDVAGMLRSFHYAAHAARAARQEADRSFDAAAGLAWSAYWHRSVAEIFMSGYLRATAGASFLPASAEGFQLLLDSLIIEKAIYELNYELNHRPSWAIIPWQAIRELALAAP